MFLFKCCQGNISGQGYQVTSVNNKNQSVVTFIHSLDQLKMEEIQNKKNKILSVYKSEYDELVAEYKGKQQKWTDMQFSPIKQHIGNIEGVPVANWKRISDILKNRPVLFDGKIEPKDVIQGSLGDCYFLSALAALAEKDQRIKTAFGEQQYNPNGIYKVQLRIDGVIKEIVVDDYVPVNSIGQPLFCQPNKNQFWVLILEKAWAKAHGSYANIVAGNPSEVFKAVSYAPSEMLIVKEKEEDREKLWRKISNYMDREFPCCCGTDDRKEVEWDSLKLVPGHAYTLLDAKNLKGEDGQIYRMMKFRNPWGKTEWEGQGSQNDKLFWDKIAPSSQKMIFLKNLQKKDDGIFFMNYNDFCKFFNQVHFCLFEEHGNYVTEHLYPNKKNGSLYEIKIKAEGEYIFQIHQSNIKGGNEKRQEEEVCRATLLVARNLGNDLEFVDGTLKFNEQDATLITSLTPGNYLVYAKLDPTRKNHLLPQNSFISIYSVNYTFFKPVQQKIHGEFLKKLFLSHGQMNKRQSYNDNKMWIAWKLVFQQGGYAYVAFGNSSESNKKFVITFNQKDFEDLNFKLKKPFKHKGNNQTLEVMPGTTQIILARVKNTDIKSMKFPPQLGIKMEPIK